MRQSRVTTKRWWWSLPVLAAFAAALACGKPVPRPSASDAHTTQVSGAAPDASAAAILPSTAEDASLSGTDQVPSRKGVLAGAHGSFSSVFGKEVSVHEEVTESKKVSPDYLARALLIESSKLDPCFEREPRGTTTDTIEVRLQIDGDGHLARIGDALARSTRLPPHVESCVQDAFKGIELEGPLDGSAIANVQVRVKDTR